MNKYDVFTKFQRPILSIANNSFGRKYLGINTKEKIVKVSPNSYAVQIGRNKYKETFRCYDLFGKKLELGIKLGMLLGISVVPHIAPIIALNTTDFFTGSGDGEVDNDNGADHSWAAAHDPTTGTVAAAGNATASLGHDFTDRYFIKRSFLPVDTTALSAAATLQSATYNIKMFNAARIADSTYAYAVLVKTYTPSFTALATSDFGNCGSDNDTAGRAQTTPITESSDHVTFGSMSAGSYFVLTLNATGLANINKIGFSPFGMRAGHDITNNANAGSTIIDWDTSETTGTSSDPYLEVVYSVPGGYIGGKYY